MNQALVMHRMLEYSLEEIKHEITYADLKTKIGGWAEIAIRCDAEHIGQMVPGCNGEPGIVVMCDSDGHPKNLNLTYFRPNDMSPLVGKLYWLSYKEISTNEGPDFVFHPLTEKHKECLVQALKDNGWGELIVFEESVAKNKNNLPGGTLGRA